MQSKITLDIPKKLLPKLEPKSYDKVLSQSVTDVSNFSENKLGENINRMVYGDKIGNSYVFTGKLLRGRKSRKTGPLSFDMESNPKIAGAARNYAGFVNKGTKKMRARPFFDQTVQDTQKQAPITLKKNLAKFTNNG